MAKKEKRAIRVKWKLFAFLVLFVTFMLAVIWLLQIMMLGPFYRNTKYRELERVSNMIENCLDTESLDDAVYSCAVEYFSCIRIFKRLDENVFIEGAGAEVIHNCAIHRLSREKLVEYYHKTVDCGGVYSEMQESSSQMGVFWSENPDARPFVTDLSDGKETITGVIYNRLVTAKNGAEYMIMLYAELTPVSATVNTLKTQLVWISLILISGALVLALLISSKISKPIANTNKAAKELAKGNYNVRFEGKGYLEIGELSDTLNYAAEELSKVDVLQKELIANVSHDLRTPLTLISGYTELMRDLPSENTPENMQVIIDETARLSSLVNDLLDISKIRAGTKPINPERFALTETVREVMMRYDKLVAAEGYHISFEADGDCNVVADRGMILQVIYNLIGNAINYVGEDRTVMVKQTISDSKVFIAVSDHGKGIPKEELPLIWDRYYRANEVHKRAVVGSGLGLSIVRGILELHGAQYGVTSTVGEGSTFWFAFPAEKGENA